MQRERRAAASRQKKSFNPGGPVIIPAVFALLATATLAACLCVLAFNPPELPGFFFIEQIYKDNEPPQKAPHEDAAAKQPTLLQQTLPADDAYMDSIVYLGDSITYGLGVYGFTDANSTFGYVGITQEVAAYKPFINLGRNQLLTMEQAVAKLKPKRIVLLIGINALGWMDEPTFFTTYEKLVKQLQKASPDSTLIIESILPVTSYYAQYADPRTNNQKIDRYNSRLQTKAKEWGCHFLNTAEVFKATDGSADINYMNGDGLHLNKNGYQLMLQYIRCHAVK